MFVVPDKCLSSQHCILVNDDLLILFTISIKTNLKNKACFDILFYIVYFLPKIMASDPFISKKIVK